MTLLERKLLISEIFGPTIQGEGCVIGKPTVFVRTAGCDFRCEWCDTLYAVDSSFRDQWHKMTGREVWSRVETLSGGKPLLLSFSGGNPALQPLEGLVRKARKEGYETALETQGSYACDWFCDIDFLTLSPKPPSSGMVFDPQALKTCIVAAGENGKTVLKCVISDDIDFQWAQEIMDLYPDLPVYLQPCNRMITSDFCLETLIEKTCWLVSKVVDSRLYHVTVLPQLHTILWGNQRGK